MPTLLPLEERLKTYAQTQQASFPNRSGGYFEKYVAIKGALDRQYFSVTGPGLALQGERFTRHDLSHVDDVIVTAGRLLGLGSDTNTRAVDALEPYELFVLLLAILLHDAGNASGREGHEKRATTIIHELGMAADLEQAEKRLISSIARAHGGYSASGDKGTISDLQRRVEIMHLPVHAQRLAAVLRLADEFSENSRRADEGALRAGSAAPPESVIHNLYCKTVSIGFDYVGHTIMVDYDVPKSRLAETFAIGKDGSKTLLIDYIRERLEKSELERRYCNRFLADLINYDRIRVKLEITSDHDVVETLGFYLEDRGYPTGGIDWSKIIARLDGVILRDSVSPPVHGGNVS